MRKVFFPLVLFSTLAACTSKDGANTVDPGEGGGRAGDSGVDPAGGPCATDEDCPGGAYACAFDVASGCAAHAGCVPREVLPPGTGNCAVSVMCACDGGTTTGSGCGLPQGYARAPVTLDRACLYIGAACASDSDCFASLRCMYKLDDLCTAKGECREYVSQPCLYSTNCRCDGRPVDFCGYKGYGLAAVTDHSCPDASTDAGRSD